MNEIPCQKCPPNDDDGCPRCAGHKIVLRLSACKSCKRPFWIRPGVTTMFEGKVWDSFDGVEITWRKGEMVCVKCPKGG